MILYVKKSLQDLILQSLQDEFPEDQLPTEILLEVPADKAHGDFSTNIAMRSAKVLRMNPLKIAEQFVTKIRAALHESSLSGAIASITVLSPGFINFHLTDKPIYDALEHVLENGEVFGRLDYGKREKVQIEFVSANPTGPLSIAHARQAAVGDALGNILGFLNFDVTKEYYVNDEGNQINILGQSIRLRAREHFGEAIEFPEECYQGAYIADMAQLFVERFQIRDAVQLAGIPDESFTGFGVTHLLDIIKSELQEFGVHFDTWSHQSEIATEQRIREVLSDMNAKGFLYEKDGALWFKTTSFGDDKDRVLKKSDGAYTYLTPDIVYHKDKFQRGFARIFNIWGPDHHGYIPRIKASAAALGYDPAGLEVLIVQLATIYRNGQPISMSTRRGQYVSLKEVLDEVGADAARYFFLMRHIKAHLDFDLELAKKETPENPVYYIQYAYARIMSIQKKAQEAGLASQERNFCLLKEEEEKDLIKKMAVFSEILVFCYDQRDPFPLVSYLLELATCFHRFYDRYRVIDNDPSLSSERMALANAAGIVLANGLGLLGISRPDRM